MNLSDHIVSFLLAALLHLLGLLAVGNRVLYNAAAAAAAAPELDVTSVELTLTESAADAPAAPEAGSPAPEAPALQPPAPAEPAEPVPPKALPQKPELPEALTPPPVVVASLQPQPSPVVIPQPAGPPEPSSPEPSPAVAPLPPAAPSVSSGPSGPQAVLRPVGGGGGAYGRIDAHPSLERAIKPTYPIGSRRRGEEGTVILDVSVSEDGRAAKTSLVSSSGFPELDRAAERAAAAARFKPGTRDGKPVTSAARLTLIFRLRDA